MRDTKYLVSDGFRGGSGMLVLLGHPPWPPTLCTAAPLALAAASTAASSASDMPRSSPSTTTTPPEKLNSPLRRVVWSRALTEGGPRHRLQTAKQVVQHVVKGGAGFAQGGEFTPRGVLPKVAVTENCFKQALRCVQCID
eukprot:690294-Prorocentrum_minimum.AAC.1